MSASVKRIEKWFDDRIEAYVDGDLPEGECRMFESRLAIDPALEAAVERAATVFEGLDTIPRYACPVDMVERVERITTGRRTRRIVRPMLGLAAAACAVAMVAAIWLGQSAQMAGVEAPLLAEQAPAAPTPAELAAARGELALALSYLDKAGNLATREISQQVLSEGLLEPMRKSVASARDSAS